MISRCDNSKRACSCLKQLDFLYNLAMSLCRYAKYHVLKEALTCPAAGNSFLRLTAQDRIRAAFSRCVWWPRLLSTTHLNDSVHGSRPCPPRLFHDTLHLLPDKVAQTFHTRVPTVVWTLSVGTHRSARVLSSTHLKYEESLVMQDHVQDSLSILFETQTASLQQALQLQPF